LASASRHGWRRGDLLAGDPPAWLVAQPLAGPLHAAGLRLYGFR
jgi:hypothetical protein